MKLFKAVAIDFETTGSMPGFRNEPWQIGLAPVVDGAIADEFFDSLINVGERPFNKYAPGRHAQLRSQIARAPTWQVLWPVIATKLTGSVLIAHNIGTERSVLAAASPLHVFGPWIDTLVLSRAAWPGLPSYALEDLIAVFGLAGAVLSRCPGRAAHDALYDAVACAKLLLHLLEQPGWDDLDLADLIALCR